MYDLITILFLLGVVAVLLVPEIVIAVKRAVLRKKSPRVIRGWHD